MQHSIDFLVAIFYPQFLSFGVNFLQFFQPEPHATDAGLIGAFVDQLRAERVSKMMQLRLTMTCADEDLV